MLKRLTKSECEITVTVEFCDIPIRGNVMASGDDAYDKKCEDDLIRQVDDGNVWAWATITVKASWSGYNGFDHLGGCSYKDEEDFIKSNDYYDGMVAAAVDDLNSKLAKTYEEIKPLDEGYGGKL